MAACRSSTFLVDCSTGKKYATARIIAGKRMRRVATAEIPTLRVNLVSGRTSPMLMPMAMRASGNAAEPIIAIAASMGEGMCGARELTFRATPTTTAITGALRKILGWSDILPEKIMMPMVYMAISTPRLCRNSVAKSSLSP